MTRPSDGLADRAWRAATWSFLELGLRAGTGLVVTIALARLLTPEDFGLMAMVMVFVALATVLGDLGLGAALIQKREISTDDCLTAFFAQATLGLVLAATIVGSAKGVAQIFDRHELEGVLYLLSANVVLASLAAVQTSLFARQLNFRPLALADLSAGLCGGAVAIYLAINGHGVVALAWHVLSRTLVKTTCLWLFSTWRPRLGFSAASLRSLLAFGAPLTCVRLLDAIQMHLFGAVIGKSLGAPPAGFFARARSSQIAPSEWLTNAASRVALPALSATSEGKERSRLALSRMLRMAMLVNTPIAVGIAANSELIVLLLFGPAWISAAPLMQALVLLALLWPASALNVSAALARGETDMTLRLQLLKKAIAIALLFATLPWGLVAIALGQSAAAVIALAINCRQNASRISYGLLAQLRDVGSCLFSGGAMWTGILVLKSLWGLEPALGLLSYGLAGLAIYLAACLSTGGLTSLEAHALWRAARGRRASAVLEERDVLRDESAQ